jgi:hypothetical protein
MVATTQRGHAIHLLDLTKSASLTSLSTNVPSLVPIWVVAAVTVAIVVIQCHMVDIMPKVTVFTDMAGLATAVAGLHEGFEGPSAVDIHQDARGKCV